MKTFASVVRLHIVAIAALGLLTFGLVFTGHRPFGLALLCGLDWFLVNLLNRVVDLREDTANAIRGTDLVARNRRAILASGFGLLAVSFPIVALVVPRILPLRLAFHALGFAYNWPLLGACSRIHSASPGSVFSPHPASLFGWIPSGIRPHRSLSGSKIRFAPLGPEFANRLLGRRIKELYFWKNTASATGFLLTVFGYPLAARGHACLGAIGVVCAALFFFLFELSYEVLYDLRDAPGDAAANVRTYPVVHGPRAAAAIAYGLCGASIGVLAIAFALHVVPLGLFVMAAAPLLQIGYARRVLARGITSEDCVRLTLLGAALLAVYNVWAALGLPGAGNATVSLMQAVCVAIVALYLVVRLRGLSRSDRAATLGRLAIVAAASFLGEDSVIRAYGFYSYAPRFSLFVDRVPLLIVLIWPIVIDSAWSLARRLVPPSKGMTTALVAAAFVLADASLIEPIAVRSGLWRWTQPGLFDVPPIGILGWALFAFAALVLVERAGALTIVLAPLATHGLLLLAWWGGLRQVSRHIAPWSAVIAPWAVLLPIALGLRARRLGSRIPPVELFVRLPGAVFFGGLLVLHPSPPLCAYAAAFVMAYLSLTLR